MLKSKTIRINCPLKSDESARLAELYQSRILDTPAESVFDNITHLAVQLCNVPVALVSLVDEHRQWFKAKVGTDITETPREIAFCAHTILHSGALVVPDTLNDDRFATNPLVIAEPYIRFYAGIPLISATGHALGSLCVIDYVPRELSLEQLDALKILAQQVVELIQLRSQKGQDHPIQKCSPLVNKRQPFFKQVTVGFGIGLALLAGVGLIFYQNLDSMLKNSGWQIEQYQTLHQLGRLNSQLEIIQSAQHSYLTTKEINHLSNYTRSIKNFKLQISQLKANEKLIQFQEKKIDSILELLTKNALKLSEGKRHKTNDTNASIQNTLTSEDYQLTIQIETILNEIASAENQFLSRRVS
jgi:CHASE3 domain sensor protein